MSDFDLNAYREAIEIPTVVLNEKRYESRVLSVDEWVPFAIRMGKYVTKLKELLPEGSEAEDSDFDDADPIRLAEVQADWNTLRKEYFTAIFDHLKVWYKPWTWFRPNIIKELENLPSRDVIFGDFFALRAAATMVTARKIQKKSE